MIAALFVETDGPYFGLEDVDPWDIVRDARMYDGPHVARKPTWLFAVGKREVLPELKWGAAPQATRLEEGFHSKEEARAERARRKALGIAPIKRLSKEQRVHTPVAFRDALLDIARRIDAARTRQ